MTHMRHDAERGEKIISHTGHADIPSHAHAATESSGINDAYIAETRLGADNDVEKSNRVLLCRGSRNVRAGAACR